jgi:hypothetical protein
MKKLILSTVITCMALLGACQKDKAKKSTIDNTIACPENPRTSVSANLQGNWMYGNFSMTEYWSTNPSTYLGNALQFAIAFKFNANGTYEQYFTSSSVSSGVTTYQQSVTKGTVVVDETNKTIKTYACSARYKRTRNGQTIEERDLAKSELTLLTNYTYTSGTEPNGTKAIYLVLGGTGNPLTFLQKF